MSFVTLLLPSLLAIVIYMAYNDLALRLTAPRAASLSRWKNLRRMSTKRRGP